jgi:hypothetical protein
MALSETCRTELVVREFLAGFEDRSREPLLTCFGGAVCRVGLCAISDVVCDVVRNAPWPLVCNCSNKAPELLSMI